MGAAKPCAIPECPALTADGSLCPVHQHAALAKSVNFAVDRPCERCKRVITKDDWIENQARIEVIGGVMTHQFRHVGCRPPKASPRTQRKAVAELPFDALPDPDPEPDPAPRNTRFEIPAGHASWVNPDGTRGERVVGAHSIDLNWPWL